MANVGSGWDAGGDGFGQGGHACGLPFGPARPAAIEEKIVVVADQAGMGRLAGGGQSGCDEWVAADGGVWQEDDGRFWEVMEQFGGGGDQRFGGGWRNLEPF